MGAISKEAVRAFLSRNPSLNKPSRPRVSVDEAELRRLEINAFAALERGQLEQLAVYLDSVKRHKHGFLVSHRLVEMLRMMIGTDGYPGSPYQLVTKLGAGHKGRPKKTEGEKLADHLQNQRAFRAFEAAGGFEPVGYKDGKAVGLAVGIAAASLETGLPESTIRTTLVPLFKEMKWRQEQIEAKNIEMIERQNFLLRDTEFGSRRKKPLIPKE